MNRPNALTVSAVFQPTFKSDNHIVRRLLNDNQLTLLANISSGDAQNITSSVQPLNGDGSTTMQRPLYVGRDTLRGPVIAQIDMRYTRTLFTIHERFKTDSVLDMPVLLYWGRNDPSAVLPREPDNADVARGRRASMRAWKKALS